MVVAIVVVVVVVVDVVVVGIAVVVDELLLTSLDREVALAEDSVDDEVGVVEGATAMTMAWI